LRIVGNQLGIFDVELIITEGFDVGGEEIFQ
jgi:hypothetical protein